MMRNFFDRLRVALGRRFATSNASTLAAAIQVAPGVRLRWLSRRWLRAAGWPGVAALGLLTVLPAFYISAIRPLQVHLDEVRDSVVRQQEMTQHGTANVALKDSAAARQGPDEQLAEYYKFFPSARTAPQWLEKLVALAESHGLILDQGEYQAAPDKVGRLVRFQMTLPLKGGYAQIREFLAAMPKELPAMALETVQFERRNIADPEVEARLKLVLYLERSS